MERKIFERLPKTGIFTSGDESSFKTDQQVKRELAVGGQIAPVYPDGLVKPKTLHDFIAQAEERKKSMKEMSPINGNQLKVAIPAENPTVHFMGDLHYGTPYTDNKRIETEVEAIKNTPNAFVVFMGDLVDGIFWGGESQSEQSSNMSEQKGFLRSLFKELKGKILFGVSGEHDSKWSAKSGADPYDIMTDESGAPYIRGVAEVEVQTGDVDYNLVAAHKQRGHSMYNKNHPTFRSARFGLQGADIYVSAHNHQKQTSQEAIREFGGKAREVTHIAVGPYKTKDGYGDREGFIEQDEKQMGGASVRLNSKKKKVEVEPDIREAIRKWTE